MSKAKLRKVCKKERAIWLQQGKNTFYCSCPWSWSSFLVICKSSLVLHPGMVFLSKKPNFIWCLDSTCFTFPSRAWKWYCCSLPMLWMRYTSDLSRYLPFCTVILDWEYRLPWFSVLVCCLEYLPVVLAVQCPSFLSREVICHFTGHSFLMLKRFVPLPTNI